MQKRKTEVTIDGDKWLINGKPTYEGREYRGWKIEGLLLNSLMKQAVFDDENEVTRVLWAYPDSGKWDPDRNTAEFVAAMPEWRQYGLIGITIALQGGAPCGYYKIDSTKQRLKELGIGADDDMVWAGLPGLYSQPWHNSAFDANGNPKRSYFGRLKKILDTADELGMVVIVNPFYFGQDERLRDERAVKRAVEETCGWILGYGYTNVVIEIANECDCPYYEHEIIRPHRMHELLNLAKSITHNGCRLLVSASFLGGRIPHDSVVAASDFILLHGNGVKEPIYIRRMVAVTRELPSYRPMPILFSEDDHYNFQLPENNFTAALASYAGWGYLDVAKGAGGRGYWDVYNEGFQLVPTNWRVNTPRKRAFFKLLAQVTGLR